MPYKRMLLLFSVAAVLVLILSASSHHYLSAYSPYHPYPARNCEALGVINAEQQSYLFTCANQTYELRVFSNYSEGFTGIQLRAQEVINLVYHLIKHRERHAEDGPYPLDLPYNISIAA